MTDANHYDVIIVGAGPAGVSTALHLAQCAPELIGRTLILEKARHPRHKLCGGGILPDGEVVLQNLGLDITEIPHCDVGWAHFDYRGKGMVMRARWRGAFAFRTVRRREFDAWLAGKARERGFLFHENTTVKALTVAGSGVVLETDQGEYHASVVVGADGSNSVVRRAVVPSEKIHTARLLEVVTEPKPDQSPNVQADAYFDFVVLPQGILGYVWDFPAVENGRPIRVRGAYDSNIHPVPPKVKLREALNEELRRHGCNLEDYELAGFPIRWFDARSRFSAPRVLLAGDAAGADALVGEGISIALGYGALAAQAIRQAFAKEDFSFCHYKASVLRSRLGRALRRRTALAKFAYSLRLGWVQVVLWRVLGRAVEWLVRLFVMIGWARRQRKRIA
jgi:flavin-dependent dehydrogenase